jgi:glutamine amidotransferase
VQETLRILRGIFAQLGISTSSSVNLFIATVRQIAAIRHYFDFGCYPTSDPARVHAANLQYLNLRYTMGRAYGWHDEEWSMQGGSASDSVIMASEPVTRDTSSWVEAAEYGPVVADAALGTPRLRTFLLN